MDGYASVHKLKPSACKSDIILPRSEEFAASTVNSDMVKSQTHSQDEYDHIDGESTLKGSKDQGEHLSVDVISEGQVQTLPQKSPQTCSADQILYLSNESLDRLAPKLDEQEVDDSTNTSLSIKLNSTISASNFISPEKLIEKLQLEKLKEMQQVSERICSPKIIVENHAEPEFYFNSFDQEDHVSQDSYVPISQVKDYRERRAREFEKTREDSSTTNRLENVGNLFNSSDSISKERSHNRSVNADSIVSERLQPDDYLQISPRINSRNSSYRNSTVNTPRSNSRLSTSHKKAASVRTPVMVSPKQINNKMEKGKEVHLRHRLSQQLHDMLNLVGLLDDTGNHSYLL